MPATGKGPFHRPDGPFALPIELHIALYLTLLLSLLMSRDAAKRTIVLLDIFTTMPDDP
jgi:hypothetical protein